MTGMATVTVTANFLDALGEERSAEAALRKIDEARRVIAGPGVFSIQRNVTTAQEPINELLLQRVYCSAAERWPVNGTKRKRLTPWSERLFLRCQPFVGEGVDALSRAFDDYALMREYGIDTVVNVPLLRDNLCYATFNVFGTRGRWQPHEVLGIRLLAMTATRWITPAPDLAYRFGPNL
jgi:hypothetical protein